MLLHLSLIHSLNHCTLTCMFPSNPLPIPIILFHIIVNILWYDGICCNYEHLLMLMSSSTHTPSQIYLDLTQRFSLCILIYKSINDSFYFSFSRLSKKIYSHSHCQFWVAIYNWMHTRNQESVYILILWVLNLLPFLIFI